jgi:hypothetical protein
MSLFTLSSALGAALLFWIQPLFGKMILPVLGGAPAVWTTCVMFYQAVLLAAYTYAHLSVTRLSASAQVRLHAALLVLAVGSLPLAARYSPAPSPLAPPVPWLVAVLALSVGLPVFALAATSPLVQRWFSRSGHPRAADPYFLYAASNLGSLLGLLAYPLVVERFLPLPLQNAAWSAGFVAFALLMLAAGGTSSRGAHAAAPAPVAAASDPVPFREKALWLLYAFVPSSLFLGVTTYLSTDIAPIPLLWVVPLALYLATFASAFARRPVVPARPFAAALPFLLVAALYGVHAEGTGPAWLALSVHGAALFAVALVFHTELARRRPAADRLTEFYFWVSAGGALGGVLNAVVGPFVFKTVLEYPFTLLAAAAAMPAWRPTASRAPSDGAKAAPLLDAAVPALLGAGAALLLTVLGKTGGLPGTLTPRHALILPLALCLPAAARPRRFGLALAAVFVAALLVPHEKGRVLMRDRSFFGALSVSVDREGRLHGLNHGRTIHGGQNRDPARSREPLTYYHPSGPAGDLFYVFNSARRDTTVAVVGLGAGSLVSYGRPDQRWTFYEIDPLVQRVAEDPRYFTFLRQARTGYRVVLGDARIALAADADARYDLLVVDAFGSDAVPVHLLTREAWELYESRLTEGGILAFHVSNRFLALDRALADAAQSLGIVGVTRREATVSVEEARAGKIPSQWVVFSRDLGVLRALVREHGWRRLLPRPDARPWTDDYSHLLGVFRWRS